MLRVISPFRSAIRGISAKQLLKDYKFPEIKKEDCEQVSIQLITRKSIPGSIELSDRESTTISTFRNTSPAGVQVVHE